MQELPLRQSVPVTLNGSGNGTAKLGPISPRETWYPDKVAVGSSQAPGTIVNEARCQIFVGADTSQANFRDGTLSGSTGDSTDHAEGPIRCGEYVWAVWSGGDAGAAVYMTVTGNRQV